MKNVKRNDPEFGNITSEGFNIFGYEFIPVDDNGNELLHITGIIERDIQDNEFSVNLDPYIKEAEILTINYKF